MEQPETLPGGFPDLLKVLNLQNIQLKSVYRMRAIITRSWFETAFNYKPRILEQKIKEFPVLVYKLSVILTALQYKPLYNINRTEKWGNKYKYKPRLILARGRY